LGMKIRPATKADAEAWLAMRMALWPDANADDLRLEVARYYVAHGEPLLPHCVFVAEDHGKIVGMLELSLRPYVDGCDSSPVPFIEGWYVAEDARRTGVGGAHEGGRAMGAGEGLHGDGVRCIA
jgi:aminoglycoside 6'-N-acetyltransferase I